MWWEYFSDVNGLSEKDDIKVQVEKTLTSKLKRMNDKINYYQGEVERLTGKLPTAGAGAQQPFAQTRGPTLLVGGIEAG